MRFYQVHRLAEGGQSAGYEYFTSKRAADRAVSDWRDDDLEQIANVEPIDITPTRAGILLALNTYTT
ncbi:hypothetical protein [Bradyrhizobium sp. 2S1]|uniref:hypothetical protein n=1 Tax=Bradyrhizobium sp. 2S1 TaxID=1404429 RepID=UPI001409F403|nr:hypothetical protein [Bradyrhizobium sp. 2S1]MCK7671466.1 hypothetical protein [Bradyrhizobium sp. 2S1]